MTKPAFCCAPSQIQAHSEARVYSLQLSSHSKFGQESQRRRKVSRQPIRHEPSVHAETVAQHIHRPAAISCDPRLKPRHAGSGRRHGLGTRPFFEGTLRCRGPNNSVHEKTATRFLQSVILHTLLGF
ncbi:uncharacterized protein M421DRAFT_423881 [Didymella exigua CBS 183.55]|uniref:Uncharacterized protein n=1 Tax=Didymella exigua CBS 183.55 TaxID=1150837 RepID=A0A6A5RDZ1_9PLEO|nr:uncharacterized protein M421DRAFT_423881 [Didymella exigua CBS 183.55]KAF1925324.1 hypothetical protein M421DRAFT_423881 [Didymella exigua CBS 183.55]